ncbi:MAG: hypothetical protein FJY97_15055 [candidate division Zixibacteria bacterium]|nr:hypothetical protein [candidate division Zixibacteria bacterium]
MTFCELHKERETVSECVTCGKGLCVGCRFYAASEPYCEGCTKELEREYTEFRKKQRQRVLFAGIAGSSAGVALVLGWQWAMFRTGFGMAMLTPFLMFLAVGGLAFGMLRIVGSRTVALFVIGAVLAVGILIGGEYIMYDYKLYQAAQQGLTAEKLFQFKTENTFSDHLIHMGVFDYAFIVLGMVFVWRRLWPTRKEELVILRPLAME